MKSVKQKLYKLIVTMCIILTFCSFIASTPVYASKVSDDFYYSGTTKGSYTIKAGFIEKLVNSLGEIIDYILGGILMAIRIPFIGWTALLERCLTWILEAATGEDIYIDRVDTATVTGSDDYVTLDAIFFNRIPVLNINFFKFEEDKEHTATGFKKTELPEDVDAVSGDTPYVPDAPGEDSLVMILKKTIAAWYYTFRAISFMVMLVILIYIGVKLAINSATKEKALYKRVLFDWLVGMILVFSIHYIMLFMISFNEIIVDSLSKLRSGVTDLQVYEYGTIDRAQKPVQNDELEVSLYEEVKTRAYDAKLTVGTTGMIMYMVLVYYAWKYTFIYLKRYLTIAVLTMIAPIVATTYAFNKVNSGKSIIFTRWFKEYLFAVLLQSIHALLYLVFLDTALRLSLNSVAAIILVFALMNMMSKSDELFRKIFGVSGKLTDDISKGKISDAINDIRGIGKAMVGGKLAKAYMKRTTRILTKPVRAGIESTAGKAFSNRMVKKADKLEDEKKAFIDNGGSEKDFKSKNVRKKEKRLKDIRLVSLGNAIANGEIDVEKLRKSVDSLKVGDSILDDDGNEIGKVSEEYIEKEEAAVKELEDIKGLMNNGENSIDFTKQYKKMSSGRALTKQFISKKWQEIMDPYQYIEVDKSKDNSNEAGKVDEFGIYHKRNYKAISKTRERNDYKTRIGKVLYGGKTTGSVSKTLLDNLKFSNLAGLNEEEKKALKSQIELSKLNISGFFGTLVGLPLLVAEPELGAMFLYKGVENLSKTSNSYGRRMRRVIRRTKNIKSLDPKTRYIVTGFEGNSIQTIANQAKAEAREEVEEIEEQKIKQNRRMVRRVRKKHPKFVKNLTTVVKGAAVGSGVAAGGAAAFLTVKTLGVGAMFTTGIETLATVHLIRKPRNIMANTMLSYQEVTKASRKHDADRYKKDAEFYFSSKSYNKYLEDLKAGKIRIDDDIETLEYSNDVKKKTTHKLDINDSEKEDDDELDFKDFKTTEDYLDKLAEKYKQLEGEQNEEYINRMENRVQKNTQTFAAMYTAYLEQERERIESLTDEELQLENDYEEPIEVVEVKEGRSKKKVLAGQSERAVIDKAIIETAKKTGLIDLKEFNKSSGAVKAVSKQIEDDLKKRGIIKSSETIDILIEDIDTKIENRVAVLSVEGTKPVENELMDESVVEAIKERYKYTGKVIDPSKVNSEAVDVIYQRKFNSIVGVKPTEESADVLSEMGKRKTETKENQGSQTTGKPAMPLQLKKAERLRAIEDRKSIIAEKAKKTVDKKVTREIRNQLKTKREVALDTMLINAQAELDNKINTNNDTDTNMSEMNPIPTTPTPSKGTSTTPPTKTSEKVSFLDGMFKNESGGIGINGDGSRPVESTMDSADRTRRVLQMLNVQTKIHKGKQALNSRGVRVDKMESQPQIQNEGMFAMSIPGVRISFTRTAPSPRRITGDDDNQEETGNEPKKQSSQIDELIKTLKSNM